MAKDEMKYVGSALVVALVVILALSGSLSGFGIGAKTSVGNTGTITHSGDCPSTHLTDVGVYAVESVKDTNGNEVVVGSGNAYIYHDGDTLPYDTLALSSSGYVFSNTGKELSCPTDSYRVIVGGSNYYYNDAVDGKTDFQAKHAKETLKFQLDKIGTFAVTADTATSFGQSSGQIANVSIAEGATYTDMKLKVAEGSGGVIRAPTVFVDYNTSAFDSVSIIGATPLATIPKMYSGYVTGYKLTDDSISNYGNIIGQLKIVAKSNTPRSEETITLKVSDLGNYISEGKIIDGYENLDSQDIGATDATYTFTVAAAP